MKTFLLLLPLVFFGTSSFALTEAELKKIGFEQNVGHQLSQNVIFTDSDGSTASVKSFTGGKPTLLVLGYYHCPMLCTLINDGLINAIQQLRMTAGDDFNILNISIDPRETATQAATKKREYLKRYGRPGAASGWHFVVGDQASINRIAAEVGFQFAYDPQSNEYAHPSGVVVLTPRGKISRYFLGINIDPRELNTAIRSAAREEDGSIVSRLVLLCYHFNPITGKYGKAILSVLRGAGLLTAVSLFAMIGWHVWRERRSRHLLSPTASSRG